MSSGYQVEQSVINTAPNVENVRQHFMPLFSEIADVYRVDQLAGDGSTRSYYRVVSKNQTYVLQTNGTDGLNYRRFIEAHSFYLKMGIPVPKVFAHHESLLWVLLEDLGSDDLQSLANKPNLSHSVCLLHLLSSVTVEANFAKSWLAERTLDKARFVFEMNHFIEHFIEKLLGETASGALKLELHDLAERAASGPVVFCHRDYQSRNLMKGHGEDFLMIDFQDSQWGPALYDAVSLCWDPYYVMSGADREALFAEYLGSLDREKLNSDFRSLLENPMKLEEYKQLLIAERFIKAVGSFASFKTTRGKDTHLVYVEDSFATVAKSLGQLDQMGICYPQLSTKVGQWLSLATAKGWGR